MAKATEAGRPTNPEDIEGINQAITILENQDKKPSNDQPSTLPAIEIIAAQTVDPRNTNAYKDNASDINPIYNHRTNRNYRNQTISLTENSPLNDSTPSSSEIKPVVVKASAEKSISTSSSSSENFSKERNSTVRHANRDRQRQKISVGRPFSLAVTPKFNGESNVKRTRTVVSKAGTTTSTSTTTTTTTTTTTPAFVTGSDPKTLDDFNGYVATDETSVKPIMEKEERLADPNDTQEKILADIQKEAEKSPAIKRFHRSSSESVSNEEMIIVNNEKVQIVRPKAFAKLVGQYPTPTAVIERLDEAILGHIESRSKGIQLIPIMPIRAVVMEIHINIFSYWGLGFSLSLPQVPWLQQVFFFEDPQRRLLRSSLLTMTGTHANTEATNMYEQKVMQIILRKAR
ncbi:hypothetical protein EVAR_47747_1 [Eumeta japonica]|uniref:Uncharacterized protein n=1 Tax=Eumeta variegata TaxID=151549 RepID=A0A4C1VVN7_EUMVA|nr:hypothetical protein EVAR_47747_1 [Eumeta japonica]